MYRGYHGVQDSKHSLLCVSYEPIEGHLGCKVQSREEPYIYVGVPENIYLILLRSPYAGSYWRKHVVGKYPLLGENLPPPFQGDVPPKVLPKTVEVPKGTPEPQMSLFPGRGSRRKRASKG